MKLIITILTTLLFTAGCIETRNSLKKNNSDSSTTIPDPGTGDTPITTTTIPGPVPNSGSTTGSSTSRCYDSGTGDQILDYYKLPLKGAGNGSSTSQWSSPTHLRDANATEGIMVTDSRLHIRLLAKPAPFPDNINCHQKLDYTKLSMKVSIKGRNSTNYQQTLSFHEFQVDECTEVLRFTTIPNNSPTEPFIMEIHDVMWDFDCRWDSVGTENCPRQTPIWGGNGVNACWQIELQMATDSTRDIPR